MTRTRIVVLGVILVVVVAVPLARGVGNLMKTRGALATYAHLIASANQGDLAAVRSLSTKRQVARNPPRLAQEGGVVGFPRQVHPNYQVWVSGDEVRLCPSNRVGIVYRFVFETGSWRYDGPIGLLRPDGNFVPAQNDGGSNLEKP